MSALSENAARFTQGSILRHVIVMTLTSAVGLMALFMVDLADLYFLSLLKDTNITAAIGIAGTLAFANLSLSIGTGIAAAALVARNIGALQTGRAKQFAASTMGVTIIVSAVYTILTAIFLDPILRMMGASGETLHQAKLFIWTLSPGFVCLAAALICSFVLRGLGDPKRAMYITLSSAITTLVLDPIFIFKFGWGIQGTAAANLISDIVGLALGLHGLVAVHRFLGPISWAGIKRDFWPIWAIGFPAVLTQLAAPFTFAYTNSVMAQFGNEALAASAIIGRVVPVAFGIIFSLSGAVGPIIGQNFGARNFTRVRQTLRDGMTFSLLYTLITSVLLFLFRSQLVAAFHATGRTAELVTFFCSFIAVSWAFAGAQFVANAAFNNLGRASLSTWTNWGKATLGTIPFAVFGAAYWGAEGVMVAIAIGSVLFGMISSAIAFNLANGLEQKSLLATA